MEQDVMPCVPCRFQDPSAEEDGSSSGLGEAQPFLEPRYMDEERRERQNGAPGPNGERDSRRRGHGLRAETEMAPLLD